MSERFAAKQEGQFWAIYNTETQLHCMTVPDKKTAEALAMQLNKDANADSGPPKTK